MFGAGCVGAVVDARRPCVPRSKAPAVPTTVLRRRALCHRNVVARCFNRLRHLRAMATPLPEAVAYYRSEIVIAAIVLWLRADLQDMA